ncbi:ribosome biogenesis GTPase Der [Egicoccus halophilus]|uniref:ribosome biogenesis GTPase Der n=1 Tax=Egicoccus halophilus TaxID=1670830 RepID=UPI00197A9E3C|nr:ribosome biogenesis GTPase Der [Egicoccus halophilus]
MPDVPDDVVPPTASTADAPAVVGAVVVAIDGPAGSGKSSVARRVAERLGLPHVDTGALYRAATLAVLRAGADPTDEADCAAVVADTVLERHAGRTLLDGEDVEDEIRGPDVTASVSAVSAHAAVRDALLAAQRGAVAEEGGVVEGRDIGSVVLPDADVKVFLTASVRERARRRAAQLGRDDLEDLEREIVARDTADGGREVAPMQVAEDAWVLDSSELDLDAVVASVVERVVEQVAARPRDPLRARRALPRVAVVGRPNVGKSTLVNRILGARVAIVEEKPGVTRDRTEHPAEWLGRHFLVVDTGGWEHQAEGMAARIVDQAEAAVAAADLVVFVVDATVGALEDDERYARLLRRSRVPVLLVANKVDNDRQEALVHELYGLGLGAAHPVSARHGRGVGDLLDEVLAALPTAADQAPAVSTVPRVAIVGKPNVGKSSLFNRLLGEERSIVDSVAHTTRDAVDTMAEIDGEPWVFVDTAGMRRRYRHGEETELYSVDRTRAAIESADLVLFLLDASEPLGEQDQRLAALLREAGRGVVLVCNKWDLVDEDRRLDLEKELDRLLSFAAWAPRVNISAASGRGLRRLLPQLRTVWDNYRRRVPTREVNRLVEEAVARHPLPRQGQKNLKIRYATQAEVAPPRFLLFANGRLPASYRRYLERELRERHDFTGVPLTIEDRPPSPRQRR